MYHQIRHHAAIFATLIALLFSLSKVQAAPRFEGQIAPLLDGMGQHNFSITTSVALADTYFNQAMALTYGFNHLEAGRSFRQVAALDPQSAMAHWGQALVLGPNINAVMEPGSVAPAYEAIQQALRLKAQASAREQGLIDALAARYSRDTSLADRAALDQAYADALRKLLTRYPDDANIRALLAEALMVQHPWNYWAGDGEPRPWTPEIVSVLEAGLAQAPRHAGLNHYYIHAVEASQNPARAMASADVLGELVPGAGHLVHMPSHIYIRTGRYQDGVVANERAIAVDNHYITQCRQQGIYPVAYVPHNQHFLWALASLQGNRQKATAAAAHMAGHVDPVLMREPGYGTLQHYWVTPLYAAVRFALWSNILATAQPAADLPYPLGVWHYARGMAYTALGRLDEAEQSLAALNRLAADPRLRTVTVWEINHAQDVLAIAALALKGELLARRDQTAAAVDALQAAVAREAGLNYNEPSDWHYPVRHSLGAVLMASGQYAQAEQVYRADLQVFPENGWSLYGLWQALAQQGKSAEAEAVRRRFEQSWQWADIELSASRLL